MRRCLTSGLIVLAGGIFAPIAAAAPCQPFRLHAGFTLPTPSELFTATRRAPPLPTTTPAEERALLTCAQPYLRLDRDGDGRPDWSLARDGTLSPTLVPGDDDLDADGIDNLFDAHPTEPDDAPVRPADLRPSLPAHLRARAADTQRAQAELYAKHGIVALEHSDEHSPSVIDALVFLLDHGLPKNFLLRVPDFRILFAFAGHDAVRDQAGFHRQMKAVSIGGRLSYENVLSDSQRFRVLFTLAHEIGHAALFDLFGPRELRALASDDAGWRETMGEADGAELSAPAFFRPYPAARATRFVSSYARSNLHEWFAESFAVTVLERMVERGFLPRAAVRNAWKYVPPAVRAKILARLADGP